MPISCFIVGRVLQPARSLWSCDGSRHSLCWNWLTWSYRFIGTNGEIWSGQLCASRSFGEFIVLSVCLTTVSIKLPIFLHRLPQPWFLFNIPTRHARKLLSSDNYILKLSAASMKIQWLSLEQFLLKVSSMVEVAMLLWACNLALVTLTCKQSLECLSLLSIGTGSHWLIACLWHSHQLASSH